MEARLVALAVIALNRIVAVIADDGLRAVLRKAERNLRLSLFEFFEPFVNSVNRFHVPAVVMVIAHDIGDIVKLAFRRTHCKLCAGCRP